MASVIKHYPDKLHKESLRLTYKESEAIRTTVYTLDSVDPLTVQFIELLCILWHPGATEMLDHHAATKLSPFSVYINLIIMLYSINHMINT